MTTKKSVFDMIQNNMGRDDVGVYMSYKTYEMYLKQAQQEERDRILEGINMIEVRALETRTMLFQDNLLALIRKMIKGKDE